MGDEKSRSRAVRRIWLLYGLLFVFSVPWYFPAGSAEPFVLGFPLWAFVSLCCYVGVVALTVFCIGDLWAHQVGEMENADDETQG